MSTIDNAVGFSLNALVVAAMPPTVLTVDDSTIVARVGSDGSDGPCTSVSSTPASAVGVVPSKFQSEMFDSETGCAGGLPVCGCGAGTSSTVSAVDGGFLEVRNVLFVNFRGVADECGPSFTFTNMDSTGSTVVFTKMRNLRAMDTGTEVPLAWFLPITSDTSDGTNHVVIEDRDGSFAGVAESWLVTRNVGMAIGCTLLSANSALRCPADQELSLIHI